MVYSIVLVDDEIPARLNLKTLLTQYNDFKIIGEASNGEDAIELCKEYLPDIVFLDIQLQDMTGFEVAQKLIKLPKVPKIVFVTAFNEYAIKAFEYSAIDYLLKPISEDRFQKTMLKLSDDIKNCPQHTLSSVQQLLERHLKYEHSRQKITLEKDGKLFVLGLKDIIYIETEDRNTKVVSKRDEYITTISMTEWQDRLWQHGFFRPHRSFLINLDEIDEIILWFNNSLHVKMKGVECNSIPISRNRLKEFKDLVGLES
ncbi:LytR/AlgR family response regulator transcription factor [Alkaliphilus peptidifermentans]|uniref:Stage 0 sporulation protein A homolog n=1 Tax=Alkaliphilus peptidifermentans DSM 18978 TaxID=1120976 RepID=A0A1G5KUK5_9FIRM|nr:LytTR family DNA-binding domain-containing protein [Alkaliphilus peptidifermentans]SCZ04024.1 two component transcriptional regulator, LytTR family [Alkaliphilus peptidifermentans DSM 18978]